MLQFSNKNVGLACTFIGLVLLVLGTQSDPALEILGMFCLGGGGALWAYGAQKERNAERVSTAVTAVAGHEPEIEEQLIAGRSLDAIALDFHTRYGVPPDIMLLFAALYLRKWLYSDDPALIERANRAIAAQKDRAQASPRQVLERLHEDGVGLYLDETVTAFSGPPSLGGGERGGLVLTTQYLFFLPGSESEAEGVRDIFEEVPWVGHSMMIADVARSLQDVYTNPFTEKRAKAIRKRFEREGSFAIPLGNLVSVSSTMTFAPNLCLDLEWEEEDGRHRRRWFDTALRTQAFGVEKQPETWLNEMMERLRLTALAGGAILEPPADAPATYTFTAANRTAAARSLDFPAVGQQGCRGILVAFLVLFGGMGISVLLISGSQPWLGLLGIFLSIAVFGVISFAVSRRSQHAEGGRDRIARGQRTLIDSLATSGGIERLAKETNARDGTPIAHARLAAAQVVLRLAQSGEPEERTEAQRLAAFQRVPVPEARQAIREFVPDDTVYFAAEPASLLSTPEGAEFLTGAFVLASSYLFFFAGAEVGTPKPFHGGEAFAGESLERFEALLSESGSHAIALDQINGLEMIEQPSPRLRIEWRESGGQPGSVTLTLGSGTTEAVVGQTGRWMTRIQLACAAVGNLLAWDERRPRLQALTVDAP